MKAACLAAILVLGLAAPALAQSDPRIREVTYDPGAVYRIPGAFRTATQIVFSPDETVRHAAVGDSVAWEIAAEGSVLFLKPREQHAATNLLVVTDRGGVSRHYVFELGARERGDGGPPAYQIRFRYPTDEAAAAAAAIIAQTAAVEQVVTGLELQRAALEGRRNLAWSAQGSAALQPSEVSDNGRFTVLRFPGGQALPAIFEVGADGSERLVPYDVRGEFVVIHGVVRGLRLRQGRLVVCLFNEAFDDRRPTPGTGTASPAVDRVPTGAPS